MLSLYRNMMRTIRQVPDEGDRKYLRDWARDEFKRNKNSTNQVRYGLKLRHSVFNPCSYLHGLRMSRTPSEWWSHRQTCITMSYSHPLHWRTLRSNVTCLGLRWSTDFSCKWMPEAFLCCLKWTVKAIWISTWTVHLLWKHLGIWPDQLVAGS